MKKLLLILAASLNLFAAESGSVLVYNGVVDSALATNVFKVTGGTNAALTGNLTLHSLTSTGEVAAASFRTPSSDAGSIALGDGGTETFRITTQTQSESINFIAPAAPFSGLAAYDLSDTTNMTKRAAVAGTDFLNLTTLTNTITFALSDMTTALTTGTNKNYWYAPAGGMTVKGVRLTLATASSSGTPTVDINEAGTTILSTKLTVDANEWDSVNAATPAVISDASIAGNAKIDFDIDTAGTDAAGAQVQILYTSP